MKKENKDLLGDIIILFLTIVVAVIGMVSFTYFIEYNYVDYEVGDIIRFCRENPNVSITHRGDNCSFFMNEYESNNENWDRTIDLTNKDNRNKYFEK